MRALLLLAVVACGSTSPAEPTVRNTRAPTASAAPEREDDSPYDAQTWIAKLDDPRETERAVTKLEQLGDPRAIKPLGEAWLAQGRPVRFLQVMISIARPLTADEAKAVYLTDFEKTGRKASWDVAVPYLARAVVEIDETNPRSVDSAQKAADALGEAKLGAEALIGLAHKPVSKKTIAPQIAAIRALGKFAANNDAANALVRVMAKDPPAHPRTAPDKQTGRALEERYTLYLAMSGASMNALAELRPPSAATPLVLGMYRTPELFTQARRALLAVGPKAKAELRQALVGKHKAVNDLFKAQKLDQYCGDRGDRKCRPVSAMTFYAAIVLGDFNDQAVVPDLLAVLEARPLPPYYIDDQPAPNSQLNAVFDSLAKLGAPDAAAPVYKVWRNNKADIAARSLAIAAYPFLTRDGTGVSELGKIAADNTADDQLRTEAATAFARLSSDKKDVALLVSLAKKYFDAAADQRKQAAQQQNDRDRKAKERAAKAYVGYAHMFLTHAARIDIAVRCKRDVVCYAQTLKLTPDAVAATLKPYIADLDSWTADEKHGLVAATIDRAMLEIGKQGTQATQLTETLLDAAKSDDRQIRGAILRALPKIATLPCPSCVAKLDRALKAGEGKTSLGDLQIETMVVRNYFAWAGR